MDDSQNTPDFHPPRETVDPGAGHEPMPPVGPAAAMAPQEERAEAGRAPAAENENAVMQRRSFRKNLYLLLSLALAAFVLTSWILVRVDAPFGAFTNGPQEIVRAQLRALDRGQLRPAYDLFSARYRQQVSFDAWHELVVTHWRMFHADVVRAGTPAQSGPRVNLEIYLRGEDEKDYRARFTLIRTDGRWWIDDVHWAEAPDEHDFSRT
jgi:Domain of unknown function (DUF4864)